MLPNYMQVTCVHHAGVYCSFHCKRCLQYCHFMTHPSPPSSKTDCHLIIFPHNITSELYIKVTRIKGNDHQLKKLLIVKQILLVTTLGNVWRTVWRICMLISGCIGLITLTILVQVEDESNVLLDGSLIDLCGAVLLWRSAEAIKEMPVCLSIICFTIFLDLVFNFCSITSFREHFLKLGKKSCLHRGVDILQSS